MMFQYPSNRVVDRSNCPQNSAGRIRSFQYPSNRVVDRSVVKRLTRQFLIWFQYPSNRVVDRSPIFCPPADAYFRCFSTLQIGSLIEADDPCGPVCLRPEFQYPSNRVVDRSRGVKRVNPSRGLRFQYPSNRVVDRSRGQGEIMSLQNLFQYPSNRVVDRSSR